MQNLTQRRLVSPSNTRSLCPNRKLKKNGKKVILTAWNNVVWSPGNMFNELNESLQTLSATWGLSATINQSNLHSPITIQRCFISFEERKKIFHLNRLADYLLLLLLKASQQQSSNQTSIHQRLRWSHKQNRKQGPNNPITTSPQLWTNQTCKQEKIRG